jgi:energy-converting hydrogenase Eha subunit G
MYVFFSLWVSTFTHFQPHQGRDWVTAFLVSGTGALSIRTMAKLKLFGELVLEESIQLVGTKF